MEKVCVKTFGCSLNHADSERIVANLTNQGFVMTDSIEDSDVVVLNSCAVKGPTESKFFTLLEKLKAENKRVVVAGCIPQSMPEKLPDTSKIGTDQLEAIGQVLEETINGRTVSVLVKEKTNKLTIPVVRGNPLLEIIPISEGCLSSCTFCITKKARGVLYSHPTEDILARVRKAKHEGVKEIYLTSPDNGCWGFDRKTNLAELIDAIMEIDGDFMVRVGMANPNHILKILPQLIEAFKHPRVYKFLHVPVQAGNNYVLEDMRRGYQVEDYEHIIHQFRKVIPDLTISTDIIVGYPTETDAFFEDTLRTLRETKPNVVNLSRFWPRPHTPAADLKELPGDVVKERAVKVMDMMRWQKRKENERLWKGWQGKVLVTEHGKEGTFIARNYAYKQVIISGDVKLGEWYDVKVTSVTDIDLRAELV